MISVTWRIRMGWALQSTKRKAFGRDCVAGKKRYRRHFRQRQLCSLDSCNFSKSLHSSHLEALTSDFVPTICRLLLTLQNLVFITTTSCLQFMSLYKTLKQDTFPIPEMLLPRQINIFRPLFDFTTSATASKPWIFLSLYPLCLPVVVASKP